MPLMSAGMDHHISRSATTTAMRRLKQKHLLGTSALTRTEGRRKKGRSAGAMPRLHLERQSTRSHRLRLCLSENTSLMLPIGVVKETGPQDSCQNPGPQGGGTSPTQSSDQWQARCRFARAVCTTLNISNQADAVKHQEKLGSVCHSGTLRDGSATRQGASESGCKGRLSPMCYDALLDFKRQALFTAWCVLILTHLLLRAMAKLLAFCLYDILCLAKTGPAVIRLGILQLAAGCHKTYICR